MADISIVTVGLNFPTYTGWWFGTCFVPYIGNFIIPTDGLICFRGVGQPPTSDVFFM
jgi:hypothetical protein